MPNECSTAMELTLTRKIRTPESTTGELFIDGTFECYTLEDFDRNITDAMTIEQIAASKVYGKTAIPTGRYEVVNSYSNRFKKYLPLLLNVKGFEGIRIHPGNKAADSLGCILVGTGHSTDFVSESRKAFSGLYAKLKAVEKNQKIYITIQSSSAL